MSANRLDVLCPECGEARRFGKREIETHRQLRWTCGACGDRVIAENAIPETLEKINIGLIGRLDLKDPEF